jgi:hypothetical protein
MPNSGGYRTQERFFQIPCIKMSKGLGNRQLIILRVFNEVPEGGYYVPVVYEKIKQVLYPELYKNYSVAQTGEESWNIMSQRGSDDRESKRRREEPSAKARLNRINVSISNSIRGLIKRGCLKEVRENMRHCDYKIFITQKGRDAIKP